MSKLRFQGDTSGYIDLEVPAVASNKTINLDEIPQLNSASGDTFTHSGGKFEIRDSNGYTRVTAYSGSAQLGLFRQDAQTVGGMYIGADWNEFRLYDSSFTPRMSVTQNGYVNMPYQPAFFAYPSSTVTVSAGVNKFTFNSTRYNIGSHYSTSTGRFTAPINGIYEFTGQVYYYPGTTASGYQGFNFRINGSTYYAGYNNGGYGDTTWGGTTSAYMNAGDYIEFWTYPISSTNLNGGGVGSYFTGRLVA